jgi:hypothetical protein
MVKSADNGGNDRPAKKMSMRRKGDRREAESMRAWTWFRAGGS